MGGSFSVGRLDVAVALDALRRSFWFLPLAAMLAGGGLGFIVPMLDTEAGGKLGFFTTSDLESARGLLETIATVTVSVAGITFSVTVVALQLASQQLGPRVLRTFQADRLSKFTLGAFLGLFVYALVALGRLSTIELGEDVSAPNLVLTIGVLGAIFAFGLFAAFIQNIVTSLEASTLIRRIAADATANVARPYPSGFGAAAAVEDVAARRTGEPTPVRAPRGGFLNSIPAEPLLEAAAAHDGLVVQRVPIGDYVTSGLPVAEVYAGDDPAGFAERVAGMVDIGQERTLVQDIAFPIRQLADVALRALSPSLNDPTTAENAVGALADVLGEVAGQERTSPARADEDGVVRFVALAPSFDDLVRLGFEQVRIHGREQPVFRTRLGELLGELERVARRANRSTTEVERQLELLASA